MPWKKNMKQSKTPDDGGWVRLILEWDGAGELHWEDTI